MFLSLVMVCCAVTTAVFAGQQPAHAAAKQAAAQKRPVSPALAAPHDTGLAGKSSDTDITSDQISSGAAAKAAPLPPGPAGDAARAYAEGDFFKAAAVWGKLADSGDAQAMNNLGVLYEQGKGVEPDVGRALHWFERSARAGHLSGMSNYGRMLEQGKGIAAKPEDAAHWFEEAASKGQPEAQYNLGILYERGRGVAQSDAAAAAWYSRAAAQQQTEALSRLGHLYHVGKGVEKNAGRAAMLLYAAAMNGDMQAITELEELAAEGPARPAALLFGQKLDNVDRGAMRSTLKKVGASPTRENDDFICDLYNVHLLAPGAGQMAVCYGPGKPPPLGFVEIDYDAPDKNTAERIGQMMEERFGPPSTSEGEDSRLWNLGTVIVATRYAPTRRQMSLMYMVPRVYYLTRRM